MFLYNFEAKLTGTSYESEFIPNASSAKHGVYICLCPPVWIRSLCI